MALEQQQSDSYGRPRPPLSPNNIIFCKKSWKLPALALAVFSLITFLWAFYILDHYLEEFEIEEYAISSMEQGMAGVSGAGMLSIAATNTSPSLEKIEQLVKPALVHIQSKQGMNRGTGPLASGVLVHPDGYVVTVLHPILNMADLKVGIPTQNGSRHYEAELISQDPTHNLAPLKLVHKDGSESSTFRAVNLRGADLRNASFNGAILTDATTDDTLTEGIELTGANIKGTSLEN